MQHYFGTIESNEAVLSEKDVHHLFDVRRAEIGESIEVSTPDGTYLCEVTSLHPLKIEKRSLIEDDRELPIRLTLAFGILKSDHNELIVLKGTELGVNEFIPFTSERTVVAPKGKEDNKLLRLRKIALEGAQQCRRFAVPDVLEYSTLKEVLKGEYDHKFFAFEGVAISGKPLLEAGKNIKRGDSVLLLIGPEGGFSDKEAAMAEENGFLAVSLGHRILRAETAALFSTSIIGALMEE